MAKETKIYHLADGVILSIGTVDTCLVDLERDYEVGIDYRYIEALEKTSLGWDLKGYESFVPRLLSENILAEGAPSPDPIIRQRLSKLDTIFMHTGESHVRSANSVAVLTRRPLAKSTP